MQLALFTEEPQSTARLEAVVFECRCQITAYKYQALHVLVQTDDTNPAFSACLEIASRYAELAYLLGRSTNKYSTRNAESWAKEARPNFDRFSPICGTLRTTLPEVLTDYKTRSQAFLNCLQRSNLWLGHGVPPKIDQLLSKINQVPLLYEQYFDRFSVTA